MLDAVKFKIKGQHFFFNISKKYCENESIVKLAHEAIKNFVRLGDNTLFLELKKRGIFTFADAKENLVCTRGRAVLAERLSGGTTYTGEVTDGALGNQVSPSFTNASTQLGSEVGRKASSDAAFDDNIAYIDFFFASGDIADGTYTEWGTFIDGDGSTPNDGRAFSLLATGGWTKSGSIYVASKYTIT